MPIRLFFLLLIASPAFAQEVSVRIKSPVRHPNFSFGIGSKVELTFNSKSEKKSAIFIGRMVDQDKNTVEFLFLDENKTRISMVNPENIEGLRKFQSQPVISPIDQVGSTCTAYGVFHFWNQIYVSKYKGTPELEATMQSDRKRMQLLEEVIDIYYINNKINLTTLMNKLGKRFGFKCKSHPMADAKSVVAFLFQMATLGKPILIDFNLGPDMVSSTYEITDYETLFNKDPRLWIPRKVGERNVSGHVIVAAASFVSRGRKKLLVLDSNWTEPRVWDLEKYVSKNTAVKEMGFHTCENVEN
jgi:hypothetical protein